MARKPRLYRRPTARGVLLLICGLGLFVLGTHFGSNAVILLAFLCVALPLVAPWSIWFAPRRVAVQALAPDPVAAGETGSLHFRLAPAPRGPGVWSIDTDLGTAWAGGAGGAGAEMAAPLAPLARGIYHPGLDDLVVRDPLGLFSVARELAPDEQRALRPLVVYPRPDWAEPAAPTVEGATGMTTAPTGEIAGLRPYRAGDIRRAVDWRASARADDLVVREYERSAEEGACIFDWAELAGPEPETLLSRIAAGVLEASRNGAATGLRLPGVDLAPKRGPAHLAALLGALAGHGTPQGRAGAP